MLDKVYSVYEAADPRRSEVLVGVTELIDAEELRRTIGTLPRCRIMAAGLSLEQARSFARNYTRMKIRRRYSTVIRPRQPRTYTRA